MRAAVSELLPRGFAPGKIGIHGTSYGAAGTLLTVSEIREIGAVIADSSFADVRDVISGEMQRETELPSFLETSFFPVWTFLAANSIRLTYESPYRRILSERFLHGRFC